MSITMILTGLRIIAVLKQMFPSFGILFETVRAAKADIFKFLTVALVLMFCFSVGGHIAFGLTLQGYSTL